MAGVGAARSRLPPFGVLKGGRQLGRRPGRGVSVRRVPWWPRPWTGAGL